MKKFICSYHHLGNEYSFLVDAEDYDDAVQRCRRIRATATVDGELLATIPIYPADQQMAKVGLALALIIAGGLAMAIYYSLDIVT